MNKVVVVDKHQRWVIEVEPVTIVGVKVTCPEIALSQEVEAAVAVADMEVVVVVVVSIVLFNTTLSSIYDGLLL